MSYCLKLDNKEICYDLHTWLASRPLHSSVNVKYKPNKDKWEFNALKKDFLRGSDMTSTYIHNLDYPTPFDQRHHLGEIGERLDQWEAR